MKQDFDVKYARRLKLVQLARHAWEAWGEAAEELQVVVTEFRPDPKAIEKASRRCRHRHARFDRLEACLAAVTGMPRGSVYNQIARQYPACTPLMTINL